jgi:hypothetical protein
LAAQNGEVVKRFRRRPSAGIRNASCTRVDHSVSLSTFRGTIASASYPPERR